METSSVHDKESWPGPVALTSFPMWSCRETNPSLYQAKCIPTCRFVTSRSSSVPFVTCGFVSGLDGVKSMKQFSTSRGAALLQIAQVAEQAAVGVLDGVIVQCLA
jgi:hypothetical protein